MDQSAPTRRKSPTPWMGEGTRRCGGGGSGGVEACKGQNPSTQPTPHSCFSLEATGSSPGPGMKAPQRGMRSPLIKLHRWSPPWWPPPRWPTIRPTANKALGGCGSQRFYSSMETLIISPQLISAARKFFLITQRSHPCIYNRLANCPELQN